MNDTRITVRLDAEHHATELEIMAPHGSLRVSDLSLVLTRLGVSAGRVKGMSTPRHRVVRTTLTEFDGSALEAIRIMQVLRSVRHFVNDRTPLSYLRAA